MSSLAYLDASAIVRLVLEEPESQALHRWYVEAERFATSRIGVIETLRATAKSIFDAGHRDRVLRDVEVIELGKAIAIVAAAVAPPLLRSLDAIHLATALSLGGDIDAFVTYDDRLGAAARAIGLPVVRPA